MQRRQVIEHAIRKENGKIKIGKCTPIYTPKVNYQGKGTKWYVDKPKKSI